MERLQKVIAHAGVASRRKAEQLILDGKVKVNDKVVRELGVKVTGKEKIEVEIAMQYTDSYNENIALSFSIRLGWCF